MLSVSVKKKNKKEIGVLLFSVDINSSSILVIERVLINTNLAHKKINLHINKFH
jgi:hypothetical protein